MDLLKFSAIVVVFPANQAPSNSWYMGLAGEKHRKSLIDVV